MMTKMRHVGSVFLAHQTFRICSHCTKDLELQDFGWYCDECGEWSIKLPNILMKLKYGNIDVNI